MNHMMPEMDGVDATVAIRSLKGAYYRDLPIVALTANALVGTREMFIRNGMNDFISKPIELNKLTKILLKWLPKAKVTLVSSVADTGATEKKPLPRIRGIDMQQGLLFVGGKEENYFRILETYYKDCRQKCITLPQHLANNDISAFHTEIHSLKSPSASIGALEIAMSAEMLEKAALQKDIACITARIDDFLIALQSILDDIQPHLPIHVEQQSNADTRPLGDSVYLANALGLLHNAAEYFQIKELEEVLKGLKSFQWSEDVTKELSAMQKHLEVFNYASILECVNRLKC